MNTPSDCEQFLADALASDATPAVDISSGDVSSGDVSSGDVASGQVPPPHCPECADKMVAFRADEERLREHFSSIAIPEVASLAFRDPLNAASGHPRRVSTGTLPMILWVLLLVLILVAALSILLVKSMETASACQTVGLQTVGLQTGPLQSPPPSTVLRTGLGEATRSSFEPVSGRSGIDLHELEEDRWHKGAGALAGR